MFETDFAWHLAIVIVFGISVVVTIIGFIVLIRDYRAAEPPPHQSALVEQLRKLPKIP